MKAKCYMIYALSLLMATGFIATSCSDDDEDEVKIEISLDEELISLVAGTTRTLTPTLEPAGTPATGIQWSSDDEAVATVSAGVVTAVAPGRTSVYAKLGTASARCDVIVTERYVDATSVSIGQTDLTIAVGHVETLTATVHPEEATDKSVKWSSSAPAVVTVDEESGRIEGISPGSAVITVTTNDGGHTATCNVQVSPSVVLIWPEPDHSLSLDAGSRDAALEFRWECDVAEVNDFILEIGATAEIDAPVYTSPTLTGTSLSISHYALNELVKAAGNTTGPLYWTVKPASNPGAALTSVRTVNLTPDTNDYLLLDESTADGNITVTKLEAAYDYRIEAGGWAAVFITDLRPLTSQQQILSLKYTGNMDLDVVTFSFISGDEFLWSVDKSLPATAEMKEVRIMFDNVPAGWGVAGDELKIVINGEPGYELELDAIHFTSITDQDVADSYEPIWTIASYFGIDEQIIEPGQTGISIKVTPRDPENRPDYADAGINFTPKKTLIPSAATILTFEYRSPVSLQNARLRVFMWPADEQVAAEHGAAFYADMPATSEWTQWRIDVGQLRESNNWGYTFGTWCLRWDPADVPNYEIEVRNFRLVEP